MMTTKVAIGYVLRQRRQELNMTLREVSPYISYAHISEVERGKKDVSGDLLDVITKSLGLSRAEFMLRVANVLHQEELRNDTAKLSR